MIKKAVAAYQKNDSSPETLSAVGTDTVEIDVATDHEPHLLSVEKESRPSVTDSDVPLSEIESDLQPSDVEVVALPESDREELTPDVVMSQMTEETPEPLDLKTLSQKISELETKMTEIQTELDTLTHKKNHKDTKQKKVKCKCQNKKVDIAKCKCKRRKLEKEKAKEKK